MKKRKLLKLLRYVTYGKKIMARKGLPFVKANRRENVETEYVLC